jgi:hypothetical protein
MVLASVWPAIVVGLAFLVMLAVFAVLIAT